ncbi:hypothetical protein WG66_016846 [Moniliophthora roreri]|nr:hypothetical protein WG66_016846 [Moniliophthora roreri]
MLTSSSNGNDHGESAGPWVILNTNPSRLVEDLTVPTEPLQRGSPSSEFADLSRCGDIDTERPKNVESGEYYLISSHSDRPLPRP